MADELDKQLKLDELIGVFNRHFENEATRVSIAAAVKEIREKLQFEDVQMTRQALLQSHFCANDDDRAYFEGLFTLF